MLYQGTVTDKNTGKPICGVPVSDGRTVVLTDEQGHYELPGWERSHTVAVCVLTNEHDDWYHYTNGEGGTYDFAITPAKEQDRFRVLHTSDTEVATLDLEFLDFIKGYAEQDKPGLFMHTGDITKVEGINKHREGTNYRTLGAPVRYAIGNHDFVAKDDPNYTYGEQIFEQLCGPVWYSFDMGGIHCVVLSLGHGGQRDMGPGYEPEDQWIWLKNDLDTAGKGKPLVAFCHDCGPDAYNFVVGGIDLKEYGLLAWIYGHAHTHLHHVRNGVHNICTGRPDCGGIDSTPAGLRRIDIKDGQVTSEVYYRQFPRQEAADEAVWTTRLEGNVFFCEPLSDGNDLLLGTMCDSIPGTCGVYRVDCESGQVRWFFPVKGGVAGGMYLDEGRVYVQDSTGFFYCLNAANGQVIWEKDIMLGGAGKSHMCAFVAGDAAIGGKPKHVFAFDKRTGEPLWDTEVRKAGDTPAHSVYDSEHGRVILNGQWGLLRSVDVKTGETVWKRGDKPVWYRTATPVIEGDVLYTGGFASLVRLDINTGETLLEKEVGAAVNVCGGPVIDGDTLYCPTGNGGVLAVDKNTLEVLRKFPVGEAWILTAPYIRKGCQTVESKPVIQGDLLIFTASDGKVYFYDKNTAELVKTINLPGPALTAPILKDGYLYVADFFGNVCKYKA